MTIIFDNATGNVIGRVKFRNDLTFDIAMDLCGFVWSDHADGQGWVDSEGVLWNQQSASMTTVADDWSGEIYHA